MSLSPDEQKKYDLQNSVALALSGLAGDNIKRVQEAQSKPFTYDGMTPLQTGVRGGELFVTGDAGALKDIGDVGTTRGIGDVGGTQNSLDYSGLTRLPGTDDFSGDARRVSDAVYQQAASRLNPQYQQRESDMRSRLAAQGISENSDAYRRELDNEGRTRNDAYNQAAYSAQQAGAAEQSRLFGLAMAARQQGKSEVDTQGNFVNSAQAQRFEQEAARALMDNNNQQQRFAQEQARVNMSNMNQQTRYDQDAQRVAMMNANQNQRFNQDSANVTLNNQARQQQIQEAAYLRNLPLNDIAALLGTGPGVADPNFQPVAQVGVAAPDYMGMVNNNYNQRMNQYNQQQAARSQMLGSIFGAAGSIGSAFALSDRRFKENVRRIGVLANGLATYAFNYLGDKAQQFGVMAQDVLDVIPDAVVNINGVLHVKYAKVF